MSKYRICSLCEGEGKTLNEAFRGQVIEPDLANDPEFMEGMMIGLYDVTCPKCNGKRVVTEKEEKEWDMIQEYNREVEREMRMLGEWR